MDKLLELSDMELDALREMGNIGTGNVATTLSKFLNKNVDMNIPETKFVPIAEFSNEVGGPEKIVSGIYLQILGDLEGEAMFMFSREGALELIDIIMGKPAGTTKTITDMEESAFKEMSNILTGTFLNALSKMLDVKLLPSVPHVATDMVQALLDFILIKVSKYADNILSVKTKISVEGHDIGGDFLVLFDEPSLRKMLEILKKKYGAI